MQRFNLCVCHVIKGYMKNLFLGLFITFALAIFSCKKANNNSGNTLSLIQHKWMLVSSTGEALRYVGLAGDYYDFSSDNFLYIHLSNTYDTIAYKLLSDNKTLSFYPVINGVRNNVATNYNIKLLNNNQFILSTNFNVGFTYMDSLKR